MSLNPLLLRLWGQKDDAPDPAIVVYRFGGAQEDLAVWNLDTVTGETTELIGGTGFSIAHKADGSTQLVPSVYWDDLRNPPATSDDYVTAAWDDARGIGIRENGTYDLFLMRVYSDFESDVDHYPEEVIPDDAPLAQDAAVIFYTNIILPMGGGSVYAWGRGEIDSNYEQFLPTEEQNQNIESIASSDDHVVALRTDGTVVAWGSNNEGQIDVPSGLSDVVKVYARKSSSAALKSDGSIVAWGFIDDLPTDLTDVKLFGLNGAGFGAAVHNDDSVTVWNDGDYTGDFPEGSRVRNFTTYRNGRLAVLLEPEPE